MDPPAPRWSPPSSILFANALPAFCPGGAHTFPGGTPGRHPTGAGASERSPPAPGDPTLTSLEPLVDGRVVGGSTEREGSPSLLVWRPEALGSHPAPAPHQSGLYRAQCGGLEDEKEGAGRPNSGGSRRQTGKAGVRKKGEGKQKECGVNHSCQVQITGELSSWADGAREGWRKNYSYKGPCVIHRTRLPLLGCTSQTPS